MIEKGKKNHFFNFWAFSLYNKSGCTAFWSSNDAQKYLKEIIFLFSYFNYRKDFSTL
jgi:hypothetical protein